MSDPGTQHVYRPTLRPCRCGQMLVQIEDSTMLVCLNCGDTRWMI